MTLLIACTEMLKKLKEMTTNAKIQNKYGIVVSTL